MRGYPPKLAVSINTILVPFLWRASKAFMPSAYAYPDKLKGGLGVIHINDMLIALTASWPNRLLTGHSTQARLCKGQTSSTPCTTTMPTPQSLLPVAAACGRTAAPIWPITTRPYGVLHSCSPSWLLLVC